MDSKRWIAIALSVVLIASVNVTVGRSLDAPKAEDRTEDDRLSDPSPRLKALRDTFASLPDPEAWSQEATSELHYRRATSEELTSNEWRSGTFLVESGELRDLKEGPETATILVPLTDGTAIPIPIERADTETDSRHAVSHAGPKDEAKAPPRVSTTTFYDYEEDQDRLETDKIRVDLKADDDGGYYGEVTTSEITAVIESNEDWWHLENIPTGDAERAPPSSSLTLVTLSPAPAGESPLLESSSTSDSTFRDCRGSGCTVSR